MNERNLKKARKCKKGKTVKKILLGLAAAGGVLFSVGVVLPTIIFLVSGGFKMNESIQIRTDTEPIYNHFPDLPKTSEIQWCSQTSKGIGLTTVKLNIFAFYKRDIRNELQNMNAEDQSTDIEPYFVPEGIAEAQKWKRIENAWFAFQTGIKDTRKLNTTVYINDTGTILYIEAIGE